MLPPLVQLYRYNDNAAKNLPTHTHDTLPGDILGHMRNFGVVSLKNRKDESRVMNIVHAIMHVGKERFFWQIKDS